MEFSHEQIDSTNDDYNSALTELLGCDSFLPDFAKDTSSLREVFLHEDQIYNGLSYKGGTILTLRESGIVAVGYLSHNQNYRGVDCLGGKVISFYEDGSLARAWLSKDHSYEIANNFFEFEGHKKIRFYKSGGVKSGYQKSPLKLKGPYNFSILPALMYFYEFGLIRACVARDKWKFKYGGIAHETLPASRIELWDVTDYRTQSIKSAMFPRNYQFGLFQFAAQANFFKGNNLEEPGPLRSFGTPSLLFFQDFNIAANSSVSLYENGNLYAIKLGRSSSKFGFTIPELSTVRLYNDGNIQYVINSEPMEFSGKRYRAWSSFSFDKHGRIHCIHENGTPIPNCANKSVDSTR